MTYRSSDGAHAIGPLDTLLPMLDAGEVWHICVSGFGNRHRNVTVWLAAPYRHNDPEGHKYWLHYFAERERDERDAYVNTAEEIAAFVRECGNKSRSPRWYTHSHRSWEMSA